MKLIIIRHGDPDYEHDSLTQKGVREAQLLSDRISQLDVRLSIARRSAERRIQRLTLLIK